MKGQTSALLEKGSGRQADTDINRPEPELDSQPNTFPAGAKVSRKREISALTLVLALLVLAILLSIPGIVLLDRLQP